MIATIINLFSKLEKKKKNQVKHVLLHEILQTPSSQNKYLSSFWTPGSSQCLSYTRQLTTYCVMTSLILKVNTYTPLTVCAYVTWNQVSISTFYSKQKQSTYWNVPLSRTKLACCVLIVYPIWILLFCFFKAGVTNLAWLSSREV